LDIKNILIEVYTLGRPFISDQIIVMQGAKHITTYHHLFSQMEEMGLIKLESQMGLQQDNSVILKTGDYFIVPIKK